MENDTTSTKTQLLKEITQLKKRITKFEKAEALIKSDKASETNDKKFRLIAENTSDAISLHAFNLKATYTYVSPAMEVLSGHKAEYLLGKSPFDFVHPDDKKELFSVLKDYLNKKITKLFNKEDSISENIEFRFKHSSGKWVYFQSTANISGGQLLFTTRDVTEQNQVQKALYQSEKKYRKLFEQSADAILIIEGGRFVDCNEATVKMLKYKNKKELLNVHPSQLSPEFQPDGKSSYQKADKMMSIAYQKGSHRFEWDHKRANGEVFPVEVLLTAVPIGEENFLHVVWRDITQRKNTEKAVKESEEKFRNLYKNTPVILHSIDQEGRLISVSNHWLEMMGYSADEVIGVKSTEFLTEASREYAIKDILPNFYKTGIVNNVPYEFVTKNGKVIDILLSAISEKDNTGKVIRSMAVLVDVTARMKAEQELQQSEHRFKRLFEDLGDAVYVTKIGGANKGQILEVNSAAVKQTGFTRTELLGMNIIKDFYIRGSGNIDTDEWEEKLLRGELVTVVEKKRRKDGTEYWTEVIVTPIDFKGEKASLSINHDITKRKYAEDALRSIATQFSALSGLEFIEKVCYHLTETLQIDYAFVGTILTSQDKVRVLAGIGKGKPIETFEYDLADTPCENVIGQSICSYPSGVQSLFPKDLLLVEMNIESYFGIPLFNHSGDALGIIVLLHSQPMDTVEVASSLLQIFSDRVAAEMERMDAEEELQDSEERFRRLSGASFEGIAVHEKGKIIDANQTLAELFGYELSEIIGLNATDLIAPESRDLVMQNILSGYEQPYEGIGLKKDGTTFYVELVGKPLPYKGRVVRVTAIRDITERKKMQEALINSEHLLRESQKVASLGSYELDIVNDKWQSSTSLDSVFGIDKTYTRNIDAWVNILYDDDREMMQNYFMINVLINHEPFNKEYRIKRVNDQQVRWVHGLGRLELNKEGNPIKMIGTIQDITERKNAEDVIRESEEKYRELIEGTKNLITRVDIQGNFTFVNQISREIYGLSPKECIGLSGFDFVYEDDKQKTLEWFDVMIKAKETNGTIENRQINKKTGEVHNLLWTCNLHYNDDGTISGISAIAKDVTEFKHAQEELTQERQRLAYILEGTNAGTWDWNIQTGELTLNDRWAEIMGYTLEELAPIDINTWLNKVHPDDLPTANALLDKHFNRETDYYHTEFRQPHKDGTWIWVNARGKVTEWSDDGKPLRMSGTHLDITERKKALENLIIALEKATESDRLKSAFLATMSHELRTPLNAIIGFSDFINEDLPIEDIVTYTKTINSSGNHLLTIVEDLFDITLIEAGEIKLQQQEENLHTILSVVHEVIKVEQQSINKQKLDLSLIIPPGSRDLIINTDSTKLKQILLNLLKNALKFTQEGHVHFGYTIEKEKNQSVIRFFVEDTGIGISKEKHEFVFDIFRQVEDSHTRIYGGTGIGLSIARKLTELLGGRIWLESDISAQATKRGTTFYFTIPLETIKIAKNTSKKVITKEIKKKRLSKEKTILIVEDDKHSFEFLKIVLEMAKMTTIWAQDGSSAIRLCNENSDIDLVLMDINMPIMNGFEATKEIKKFRPKLPIIAQTAYAILGDREKALSEGCDDYISKPIKKEVLMSKIDKLLGG